MATNRKRSTGEILPRNYGLRLSMPLSHPDIFVSPIAYAIAQVMLESPAEIRARMQDYARRHEEDPEVVSRSFVAGVLEREHSKNLLNFARRTAHRRAHKLALQGVERDGRMFIGEVKSKGRKGLYKFTLPIPDFNRDANISYPGARTGTNDNLFNEGKGKNITVIGIHLAVPEIAIYQDGITRLSQEANMTGLAPKDRIARQELPNLPFTFNFFSSVEQMNEQQLELYQTLTDIVFNYYLKGLSQYESSVLALQNPNIYSPELIKAILHQRDRAQFKVLRQDEKEVNEAHLTPTQDRRYAAVTTLLSKIRTYLEKFRESHFAGYCREFVGTPWETVARRFEPSGQGPVYSVVTSSEHPPLIVGRLLKHKAQDWINSYDPFQTDNIADKIGLKYSIIDDQTRRESTVELILPDEALRERGIHIPENLQREYDALRARIKVK